MVAAFVLRVILIWQGVSFYLIYPLLPTRIDTLICGGAAALLVRGPLKDVLPVKTVLVTSGICVLALVFAMKILPYGNQILATIGYTAVAVFFACLVFCAQQGRGWIARIGSVSILRFFGRYSYGLYMYHGLLFEFLVQAVHPAQRLFHSELLGGIILIIFSLGASLGIAMLSYRYFEAPILRLKRKYV
jgi:peptidoglycan/LPS O-acetylase OafA/YrhL